MLLYLDCESRYCANDKEKGTVASKRQFVKLKSTESAYFYYTTKNKTRTPHRLSLKKYDPYVRKHVEFKETK